MSRSTTDQAVVRFGGWCALPSAYAAEVMACSGFDWVLVDMQHGMADYATACDMVRAIDGAGAIPFVRPPHNDAGIIGRMLDAGAMGVIAPMIQSAADARAVVDACLYPPTGRRSFGPLRALTRHGPGYVVDANQRIAVYPMIETAQALEAVDEILQTPGVTGAFVGPMDLSVALGLPPRDNDGARIFDEALGRVISACERAGKIAAVYSSADLAPLRVKQGFRLISVINDASALAAAARAGVAAVSDIAAEGLTHAY